MKNKLMAGASLLATLIVGQQAHANAWQVGFSGPGVSARITFTGVADVSPPDPNPNCGTAGNNPCRHDPAGGYMLTGISGTFTDTNAGINNAAITALVPISPTNERDLVFDPAVPTSLSYIDFTNESPPGAGLSYDDLFFPGGNPIDCDYPFDGTLLDVFGAAFTVTGGDTVVLWGDGDFLFGPLTYGVGVTDGTNELDYQFSGLSSVPEPQSLWLLASGLLLLGVPFWRRANRRRPTI
jgi:hypothetical protein